MCAHRHGAVNLNDGAGIREGRAGNEHARVQVVRLRTLRLREYVQRLGRLIHT